MEHTHKSGDSVVIDGRPFQIVSVNQEQGTASVLNNVGLIITNVALDLLVPVDPPVDQQALDAARWNAFLNCGRIRLWGWAGVDSKTGKPDSDYVHFGGEFWNHKHGEETPENRALQQSVLTAFADAQIALDKKGTAPEGEPINYYDGDDSDK